jgi:hypothetical protein
MRSFIFSDIGVLRARRRWTGVRGVGSAGVRA